jgi:hypothetical protein
VAEGGVRLIPVGHNESETSKEDLKDVHALEGPSLGLPTKGETEDGTTNNRTKLLGLA